MRNKISRLERETRSNLHEKSITHRGFCLSRCLVKTEGVNNWETKMLKIFQKAGVEICCACRNVTLKLFLLKYLSKMMTKKPFFVSKTTPSPTRQNTEGFSEWSCCCLTTLVFIIHFSVSVIHCQTNSMSHWSFLLKLEKLHDWRKLQKTEPKDKQDGLI